MNEWDITTWAGFATTVIIPIIGAVFAGIVEMRRSTRHRSQDNTALVRELRKNTRCLRELDDDLRLHMNMPPRARREDETQREESNGGNA